MIPLLVACLMLISPDRIAPAPAVPVSAFLNSIGANSSIARRGETLEQTTACARYLGLRWFRSGPERDVAVSDIIKLHRQAGVRFSWSPGGDVVDLAWLLQTGRQLAAAGALLAFEGPNEPNNWGITYQGQAGGRDKSWMPVAKLQSDLYRMVKSDAALRRYPVWNITEGGAETDNAGLQFLTVPPSSGAVAPAGTRYADYANVHNYIYHPNAPGLADNKTWDASDPTPACRVDGLYGEYGITWARHFKGYPVNRLLTLPRVTTETGCAIDGPITEEVHALNLLSLYLDQFKRGWSYTAVYLLRDRVDEAGNQQFGFYRPDYSPRKAAVYLHNLTTILADSGSTNAHGSLAYRVPEEPATVHDMLLQKSNGTFELVIWAENLSASSLVEIRFDRPVRGSIYNPTEGTQPMSPLTGQTALALTLTDHPLILEIER